MQEATANEPQAEMEPTATGKTMLLDCGRFVSRGANLGPSLSLSFSLRQSKASGQFGYFASTFKGEQTNKLT